MENEVNGGADERITPWLCLASGAVWRDPVRAGHTQAIGLCRPSLDSLELACSVNLIYQPDGLGNFLPGSLPMIINQLLACMSSALASAPLPLVLLLDVMADAAGAGCALLG
jgi:hypothetical protein